MSETIVGQPMDRVDGRLKITGKARYAAEFKPDNLAHAVLVSATISKGRLKDIDSAEADGLPGVLKILTHKNAPPLKQTKPDKKGGSMPGDQFVPLQNDRVHFDGQAIAVVVAETLEQAFDAAERLRITYDEEPGVYDVEKAQGEPTEPDEFFGKKLKTIRGDADAALKKAAVSVDHTYITPVQNHNAMEPSATVAAWEGENLTLYDATQGVMSTAKVVAEVLDIPVENVRTICLFTGGGFGCKGFCWPHTVLAAVAARTVKRPVQLVLRRQQTFTCIGHREKTVQKIQLGADKAGKLEALKHLTTTASSTQTEFVESCGLVSGMLYACPNVEIRHHLHKLDIGSPTPMRAPGECSGSFALECALDELAHELKMDPLQLRLVNYAEEDPEKKSAWSSKQLKQCYEMAAEKFGWTKRKAEPGANKDGKFLVGYGMATASYPANKQGAAVKARIYPDGSVVLESATQDIGTGTYTIMTQIAADALGMPAKYVRFELGDSKFPKAPVSGGSQTAASVGEAVQKAAKALRSKLAELSIGAAESPLHGKSESELISEDGRFLAKEQRASSESYADIVRRNGQKMIEAEAKTETPDKAEAEAKKISFHSFGAQFVEVRVDPELGKARVSRVVSAFDVGRILNRKTARSQAMGGIVFGIGMALLEQTVRDPKRGRVVTRNLADYLVPVNADVPEIEILFPDVPDEKFSPTGARGVGEIGITGISAAIANAIFNATGKRVRELPITVEKLLA